MPDLDDLLAKLDSPEFSDRFDACELLRVAPSLPEYALVALERLIDDPHRDVADAARRALVTHGRNPPPPAIIPRSDMWSTSDARTEPVPRSSHSWLNPVTLYDPSLPAGRALYFWGAAIFPFLVSLVILTSASLVDMFLGFSFEGPVYSLATLPTFVLLIICPVLMAIRRLRDLGRTGWYILLGLIPLLNIFFALWLLSAPGIHSSGATGSSRNQLPLSAAPDQSDSRVVIPQHAGRRQCPFCAEWIMNEAILCRFCGRDVSPNTA